MTCPETVRALDSETFDDFRSVGTGAEARRKVAPLSVDGHSIDPVIDYKVLDVLTPHVFAAETLGYTDNVFHQRQGATRSPFSRTTAGTRGDVTVGDHVFSLGWRGSESLYFKSDQRDYFEQLVDARLDLNFTNVAIHGEGSYARTIFPSSIQIVGLAVEQAYETQWWAEARFNRVGGKVGVFARRDDFESSGSLANLGAFDHVTLGGSVQGLLRIYEKLDGIAEYSFEAIRFDRPLNSDYDAHQVRVGVNGALGEKLTLSVKAGYTHQLLRGSSTTSGSGGGSFRGFNAAVAANYQLLPTLTISASYRRDLTWSVAANYQVVDDFEGAVVYRFGPGEKLSASARFGYAHAQPDSGGHLDRVRASVGLGYRIQRWLDVSAFYGYEQALGSGRFRPSEFDEHRVGVSVAVGL